VIDDGASSFGLIKEGTGNLTLGGANTYDGATTVNNGTLILSGSLQTGTALTISPTVAGGAAFTLASGTANPLPNVSALSIGSFTGPTSLSFDLGANTAASDSITTPNAATTAGTVNIGIMPLAGFGSASTYDLISAPSGLSGATYTLTNAPGGFTYSLTTSDTVVRLNATAAAGGNIFWRGNTGNSWSTISGSDTNWYSDAAGSTNAQANPSAGNTVNFSTVNAVSLGGVITTTLDNNFTVKNLLFGSDPNGVNAVNIAGGTTPGGVSGVLTIAPTPSADGITVGANAGSVTISAPVILGADQNWSADGTGLNGSTLTVSGAISGTNALTISGLVTLSAPALTSNYSGATTVDNGDILQGGATNSFSSASAVTVNGTGILRLNGFSNTVATLTGNGTVQNNHTATAATLTVGDATDFTFGGTLQNGGVGTLGLTKTGAGKLTLNSTNTHTGMTTVNAGTLTLGAATTLTSTNNVTLSGTGTLDLNGFDQTIGSFSSASTSFLTNNGAGSGTNTITISTAGPTLAALITDGPTSKIQLITNNANSGTAFMSFTNGALNTFSGGLVLANNAIGTRLYINAAITGTPFGTGPIIIGQSAADKSGIFFATAGNTFDRPLIVNTGLGSDRYGIRNDGQTIDLSGLITANADLVFSSNSATASNTNITNKVTGAGGLVIDLSQTSTASTLHTVTLTTVANTNDYAGDTQIGRTNATPAQNYTATLALGAADQIPNGAGKGNVTINNNTGTRIGFFSLAGFNETINGLSGNGTVDSISGTPTLTLGDNNSEGNFSGKLQNTASTLTVTKIGSGTQTFSGASTFAGDLNVDGGLVAFATSPVTDGPLGNSTVVNLSGGGISYTASGANNLNRPIVIGASNGTVDVASSTGVLTVAATSTGGNLIKTGSGTALITGSTTLNGGTAGVAVNEGTLQAGYGTAGVATISVGATGNLDQRNSLVQALTLGNAAGALTLSGGAQLGFELNGGSGDRINVGASGTAVTSGVVTLNFYNAGLGLGETVAPGTYTLLTAPSGLAAATYALGTAPNGFNYTINKTDTLVSLTVTAYTPSYWRGGQNLSWNTLGSATANWTTNPGGSLDAASVPGSADTVIFSAAGAPTVTNTITTTLDAAFVIDSLQFSSVPSGITDVTITAGTGGALTLTPLSTSGGIRVLASGGNATISAPLTIGAAQTWDVDPTGSLAISGDTAFNFAVNKTNTGVVTLSGTNSGSGAFTLSSGSLNINSTTALGSGVFTIGAGTTINVPSGAIALTPNNVQNWNGDFTFTGSNDLDLGTGAVTLGSSITLTTTASTLTVGGNIGDGSNNRGITKTGAGSMVLKGTNTYGGLTILTNGVLRITNSSALGATTSGSIQSGTSALEIDGTGGAVTVGAEPLTISGGGISNQGALRNLAGNNTFGGTITMAIQSRINSDSGTLTLSNPAAVNSSNLTLVVGGAGNITISGAITLGTGGVTKGDAGILTLSGNNSYTGNTTLTGGTLNITGALNSATTSAFAYGNSAANTIVNVSNNMTVGNITGANNAGSNAVYNQTAGIVSSTSSQFASWVANNGGYGYFNLTGGSFATSGGFNMTVNTLTASTGVAYIASNLDSSTATGNMVVAYSDSSKGSLTVAPGGTLNYSGSAGTFFLTVSANSYGVLNIAGGDVNFGTRLLKFGNAGANQTGFVNLAGGSFTLGQNFTTSATSENVYVNYAGGTLKASANLTNPFNPGGAVTTVSTIFGAIDNSAAVGNASQDFTGGLTVNTNANSVTLANSLLGANTASNGVKQTNITVTGGTGYIGAPMVQFTGGTLATNGSPAAGYALINPSTGAVTGIVITSPGEYTVDPTVTLTGGGGTGASVALSALTPNAADTGLTKIGLGTLTLSGANTFTGATLVSGGTLQLNGAAAGAPTTSAVTVGAGGTLGFTAAAASTLDLTGKAMSLGGTLNFDIGSEGLNDAITVQDFTLTGNSAFTFNSIGAVGGTYTLVTSANPITAGGFGITGQTIGRTTLTPTINTNTITVTSSLDEGRWNQAGGGNWSVGDPSMTAGNWDAYKPTIAGDAALFGSAITAPSTVVVDTPHTVGFLRFANANAYTIGSNGSSNLTFNNGVNNALIAVTSGSHIIAENVALLSNVLVAPAMTTTLTMSGIVSGAKNVTMDGDGLLELSGANTYSGVTTVSAGTLKLSGNRTAAATGGFSVGNMTGRTGSLNVTNGEFNTGTFVLGSGNGTAVGVVNQSAGTLTLTGGTQLIMGNGGSGGTLAGAGGNGTYNLSGGTLTATASASRGVMLGTNDGGTSTFNLSGTGTLTLTGVSVLMVGRSDSPVVNTTNLYNQTGGTATVTNFTIGGAAAAATGLNSTFTVTGGMFSATAFSSLGAGDSGIVAINIGGTGQVTLPAFPLARGSGTTTTITFDSTTGYLRPTATSTAYMPASTLTTAKLTANGAKFDTNGFDIAIAQVLEDDTTLGTLTKSGVGTLSLTGANIYTGVTTINGGTLQMGNGATGNDGTIANTSGVINNGTLAFNLFGTASADYVISGSGVVTKLGAGTQTLTGVNTYSGLTSVTGGTLQISAANNLGDGSATNTITLGAGTLRSTAGTYDLGVNRAITMTGAGTIYADADTLTVDGSITNGANGLTLRGSGNIVVTGVIGEGATPTGGLTIGVNAAGGQANVTLSGNNLFTGNVSLPAANTVPKAMLTLTNSGALGVGPKTVSAQGGGEIHLQNGISLPLGVNFTISGLTSIWNDSGNNTIQGNIAISSGNGDSALISTSGLLTVSGNVNASATIRQLRLRGDGNGAITGIISNGTTVNMPVLKDTGTGTWTLSGVNTYTGFTTVSAGTLLITGSIAGTANVATTGTLGGNGTITGVTTVATTGTLSPGSNNVGTLNLSSTLTLDAGSNYAATITGAATNDKVNVTGAMTANGNIVVTLSGYAPVLNDTFDLADAASITGTPTFDFSAAVLTAGLAWDTSTFATDGKIKVISGDPFLAWATANTVIGGKGGDDDGDGVSNLLEFATNSNPQNGGSGARVYAKMHTLGGDNALTYTVATRKDAVFAVEAVAKQRATKDKIQYTLEATNDLITWDSVVVTELGAVDATAVRAAIVPALPALDADWEWHTFRTDGGSAADPQDFIRLQVEATP
jgi:autotransporter-associated beta strand protein